jgi:transposase
MSILSTLPEIGQLSARQIASLAGLAPKNRDSGQYKGTRSIIGGRMPVRNNLYMSVISLIRLKDNKLSEFYRKLREQGKPAKVAIIATARKLLIILNSMIKNKTKWNEA